MPDSKGRITITVMGSFECPNCGHKWRGVVSKIKVGGEGVEVEAAGKKKEMKDKGGEARDVGEIIEIDLDDLEEEFKDEEI